MWGGAIFMVTMHRQSQLQVAVDDLLEKFAKFDYQVFGNLRIAVVERDSFRLTGISDKENFTILFHHILEDKSIGYAVIRKSDLTMVEYTVHTLVCQYVERAIGNMKVMMVLGRIDPKYF